jgi:hypothetical protein
MEDVKDDITDILVETGEPEESEFSSSSSQGRPSQKEIIMSSLENIRKPAAEAASVELELGDIIEIAAPRNTALHETTHFITYIDSKKIKLLNIVSGDPTELHILNNGLLSDESIQQIALLSRSEQEGYARQNGLLPRVWVEIKFGGEIPAIVTAEITDLQEDMIELTTFPELRVLYIDFAYQGIPENIPIDLISIREKPASVSNIDTIKDLQELGELGTEAASPSAESGFASMEQSPTGEMITTVPENVKLDENIRTNLHSLYIDAHSIFFGEELPDIAHLVEIPENQQRYSLDAQLNDLTDELLSTIPTSQRTKTVLDSVHIFVERFKELRQQFSEFDANANVNGVKIYGAFHKPLVEHVLHMDKKTPWILPVAKNRRKIYDLDPPFDTEDTLLEYLQKGGIEEIEEKQMDYYQKNSTDLQLSYPVFNDYVQSWFRPTENMAEDEPLCIAMNIPVNSDTTFLVDNLGNYESHCYVDPPQDKNVYANIPVSGIAKKRFLTQTYTTGLTRLVEQISHSGKKTYARGKMTEDETVNLKSLVLAPFPVAEYSTIFLPGTRLIDSVKYHATPLSMFRFLRSRQEIQTHEIEDLGKEFKYIDEKSEWMKEFHGFSLDTRVHHDEDDVYKKLLQSVLPKTWDLLNSLQYRNKEDKTSFLKVVSVLRPFMIYPEHITFSHYKHIRYLINNNTKEMRKMLDMQSGDFATLRNAKYGVKPKKNEMMRLLEDNKELSELFLKGQYMRNGGEGAEKENEDKNAYISSAELTSRIIALDYAKLYTNLITSLLFTVLNTPKHILDGLAPAEIDDVGRMEKVKATDSAMRYLAKKYDSVKKLKSDNNIDDDLFYDKEFDDTPYDLLKNYKEQQTEMPPDLFFEYLKENLIQRHDCPKETAGAMAATLIAGKKRVADGDYAILEILPQLPKDVNPESLTEEEKESLESQAEIKKKTEYYKRQKGIWINDPKINSEAFLDNASLFANISASFYTKTRKEVCDDIQELRLKRQSYEKELNKRVTIHAEDLSKELEKNIDYHLKMIRKLSLLKEIQDYRANRVAHAIGTYANTKDIASSPHAALCDLILGQDDFVKKQADICLFVDKFCRQAMVAELAESPAWLYCKETNIPLFPVSLHQLAMVFTQGGDYSRELDKMCREQGILSDDGNAIVDRHTGRILRKIDFVTEEGFSEEGFRITTHAILENDTIEGAVGAPQKKIVPVFENKESQIIYNVSLTLCQHIDIPFESIQDFVMRLSTELIAKHVSSEDDYKVLAAKTEKKTGKPFTKSYEKYKNEIYMNIIPAALLIAIQTATPSFRTRKTFPGCVRSFSGYPLNGGVEDLSALRYMACVIKKTAVSSSVEPWGSIKGYTVEVLLNRLKDAVDKFILKRPDIEQLYQQKREYILLNPDIVVPEEHSIVKWQHFLPPVVPFEVVKRLQPLETGFGEQLKNLMRDGKMDQFKTLAAMRSKIVEYGYAVIEIINDVVHSKLPLLKTTSQIPFLENACCNQNLQLAIPFLYFKEEDGRIAEYAKYVRTAAKIGEFVKRVSLAPMFYHVPFTGIRFPIIPSGHLEENVYAAVIHYCHLDRADASIPAVFYPICNELPKGYQSSWSLIEKKDFFNSNGIRYTTNTLYQLMRIVNQQNRVEIDIPLPFYNIDGFRDVLAHFDMIDSTVFERNVRDQFSALIQTYNQKQRVAGLHPALEDFKRYFSRVNNAMYQEIVQFLHRYGGLSSQKFVKIRDYLFHLCDWTMKKDPAAIYDDELFRIVQYVKNMVYMFAKVYPAILQGNDGFYARTPKHWNISQKHRAILMTNFKKYFSGIEGFKQDPVLKLLLLNIAPKIGEVYMFLEKLPFETEIVKPVMNEEGVMENLTFHGLFDKSAVFSLLTFAVYSTLYEYIRATNDPDVLRADVQEYKTKRRAKNAELMNVSNRLSTIAEVDETDNFVEVQIEIQDVEELKKRLGSLLVTCLELDKENKDNSQMSYKEIMETVNRAKEREKRAIIEDFKNMGEQRRVENLLKNYRIGRWNVGQQKGLFEYDKTTFDREINEMKIRELAEIEAGGEPGMDMEQPARGVEDIELDEEAAADQDADMEANDIGHLGENYYDGGYYSEDAEYEDD